MFPVTETNDLIRYFDESPYEREHEMSRELLEKLLNDKGYDGILDVQEIKKWVNKQSEKNTHIWKEIVYEKVKLASEFDPNMNKEAARFVQKHGHEKILDKDKTEVNCIMLVEDLPNFDTFLNVIKKQGYKPNSIIMANQDSN